MTSTIPQLEQPPIVEAVLDFDCELPAGFNLEAAGDAFRNLISASYPKDRKQFIQQFEMKIGTQSGSVSSGALQALQFINDDDKQLVQVRAQGLSFNRLSPYSTLDDYLPEIERVWKLYLGVTSPVQVRAVRLRYINRILVPMVEGSVDLDQYLRTAPQPPEQDKFTLSSFLIAQSAVETTSRYQLSLVLTSEPPSKETLPVILDITVAAAPATDPSDWSTILRHISGLRDLKNRVFANTLTEKCINLFRS